MTLCGHGEALLAPAIAVAVVSKPSAVSTVVDGAADDVHLHTSRGTVSRWPACLRAITAMFPQSPLAGSSDSCSTVPAQVDAWVEFARNELPDPARLSDELLTAKALVRTLLNMGVANSKQQLAAEKLFLSSGGSRLARSLTALEQSLACRTFLATHRLSAADVAVFAVLSGTFAVFVSAATQAARFPHTRRWFATVAAHPAVVAGATAAGLAMGGVKRVGGQIDARPRPVHVSACADVSIARNRGQKKAASQRDKEKAARAKAEAAAKAAAQAAAGGASAAAGGSDVAASFPPPADSQPEANLTMPELAPAARIELAHARLTDARVPFSTTQHAAANTVADLLAVTASVPGRQCKNLFLKAKKPRETGDSMLWLVTALHDTRVDLKLLAATLGYGKIVMRLGSDKLLLENMGVVQGNVTPLCAANDPARRVRVVLDARIFASDEPVLVHPLTNEASTSIAPAALLAFLHHTRHVAHVVDFEAGTVEAR